MPGDREMDEVTRPLLPLAGWEARPDQGPLVAVPLAGHVLLRDHDVPVAGPDFLHDAHVARSADAEGAAVPLGHRAHGRGVIDHDAVGPRDVCPLTAVAEQKARGSYVVDLRLDVSDVVRAVVAGEHPHELRRL